MPGSVSPTERVEYCSFDRKGSDAHEWKRLVTRHAGLRDYPCCCPAMGPRRPMDEKWMTHEDVSCSPRRVDRVSLNRCLRELARECNEVDAGLAVWLKERRHIEVRSDFEFCRRIVGTNVGQQEQAQQSPSLAAHVEPQGTVPALVAPVHMPSSVTRIGCRREPHGDCAANSLPLPPRSRPESASHTAHKIGCVPAAAKAGVSGQLNRKTGIVHVAASSGSTVSDELRRDVGLTLHHQIVGHD
jgi:hypothetical protein